jgi:SH3 domain-containing protein
MIRHAAAIAVALCLSPSWLCAQSTVFTVNTASANVYKSPSTGSLVIGTVARNAVLEVTRELGSWVKVVWPIAKDGVGYVHVSAGLIARGSTAVPNPAAGPTPAPPTTGSAPPPATAARPEHTGAGAPAPPMRTVYIRPPAHIVGVGGRMGGPRLGFGASARAWPRERFGVQFDVSRYALVDAPAQLTSIEFTPSVLFSLPDRVTDYLLVRPYLGAGPILQRQSLNSVTGGAGGAVSDNQLGFQAFGGGEVTFASVPRFTLSVDLGYHWLPTSFSGFELGGLGLSVSGHWYIK